MLILAAVVAPTMAAVRAAAQRTVIGPILGRRSKSPGSSHGAAVVTIVHSAEWLRCPVDLHRAVAVPAAADVGLVYCAREGVAGSERPGAATRLR